MCVPCWNARNPGKPAPAGLHDGVGNIDPEPCGYCGALTTAGIFVKMAGDPKPVACPLCGKPALQYDVPSPEGTVTVIGCNCMPRERAAFMPAAQLDQRLTGARIPRFMDLNSPEVLARLQRLGEAFRRRYPQPLDPADAWNMAAKIQQLRETGFTDEDRRELLEWANRVVRGE